MTTRRTLVCLLAWVLVAALPAPAPADTQESWRSLGVRVLSERDGTPLVNARVVVEVVGAPVWDGPREVPVRPDGTATVWIPRWGGPVRVTAQAKDHLPTWIEAGPEAALTLRLPELGRASLVRPGLVDETGRGVPPVAIPQHATLVIRAYGDGPGALDEERFATWSVPARAAFVQGLDLPAGACDVCLRAPAWVPTWTRITLPSAGAVRVPLPPRAAQPLRIEVVDAATGAALPRALVTYAGWGEGQVRADAGGRLEIPYLPGDRLPEAVTLGWSLPGWARARWYTPEVAADGRTTWRLGMHRAPDVRIPVREANGRVADVGVAWSLGGAWPTQRRRIAGGVAALPLPVDGQDDDLRYAFASKEGFGVVEASLLRSGAAVALRPWRRIRGRVDRAGEPCPGSCQVGVHLLPPLAGALDPTDLPPWAWTADIAASGLVDAAVPEDPGCVLQVDVGRRTAFFRASDLWERTDSVLRLGPELETAPRVLTVLSQDGEPVVDAEVELRWWSPEAAPRPVDLVYRGRTDDEGRLRHYGPAGPYAIVLFLGTDLHAPDRELRYDDEGFAELRVPASD